MRIGTGVFREALKAIETNRVGEEYAVEAVNFDLRTGAIVPINGAANCMTTPAGAERIHYWKGKVACFTQRDVSVLKHPNNDNLVWAGSDYGQHPRQASEGQLFAKAQIEWEYAQDVRRDWPLLNQMATQMGITQEQLDALFIQAATL